MFFGRKKELNSILDSYGASFLYGGRQLGKTALLLRASSVSHNPAEKKFGLYLNINKLNKKDFVQKLSQTLSNKEYGLVKKKHQTLESLCQELSKCFDEGKIQTLKLFIDEADTFLKAFFHPLTLIIKLLYVDDTGREEGKVITLMQKDAMIRLPL